MASSGCFAAAEDLLPVFHRLRCDISAPARDLTGVSRVLAGWSEHVSVSRPVCLTPGRTNVRTLTVSGPTTFLTHPLAVSDEDPVASGREAERGLRLDD